MQFFIILAIVVMYAAAPCAAFIIQLPGPGIIHKISSLPTPHVYRRAVLLGTKHLRSEIKGTPTNLADAGPSLDIANTILDGVAKAATNAVEKSTGEGTESGGPGIVHEI